MNDLESENLSSESDLHLAESKALGYFNNACEDYHN